MNGKSGNPFRFYRKKIRKALPQQFLKKPEGQAGQLMKDGGSAKRHKFWGSVVITALHNQHNAIIGFTKVTRDLSDKS
jgi:hypothetical protein